MKFVVITGMSGAGKSSAIRILEDMGYYCIDNMPPMLFSKFAELCSQSDSKIDKVAFVIDLRGGELFKEAYSSVAALEQAGNKCEILFLDADDGILVKRYKESRRKHPLATEGRLLEGIEQERELLAEIRSKADYVVNTSDMSAKTLKEYITNLFEQEYDEAKSLSVNVVSFGFKYGIPLDSDLMFDVRFLPNPFYVPELKPLTGLDARVSGYVKQWPQTKEFTERMNDMLGFLMPHYIEEGKSQLTISIGCTGGKHRSVTLANEAYKYLVSKGYRAILTHRDISRDR
ncbi:MAG: RNase adapter RapZ [Ruminococcaceae bacterium]|nr:RNase adapter RapZ [Oscillospiraceae bacterium]